MADTLLGSAGGDLFYRLKMPRQPLFVSWLLEVVKTASDGQAPSGALLSVSSR